MSFLLRRTDFHGVIDSVGWRLKIYTISADGQGVDDALLDAARETAGSVLPDRDGCGFLILHRGEDANWLLVHWWEEDILCQRLLRAAVTGTRFAPAESHLFACVWELHVIDHERRAWSTNVLGGRPDGMRCYLDDGITVRAGASLSR